MENPRTAKHYEDAAKYIPNALKELLPLWTEVDKDAQKLLHAISKETDKQLATQKYHGAALMQGLLSSSWLPIAGSCKLQCP